MRTQRLRMKSGIGIRNTLRLAFLCVLFLAPRVWAGINVDIDGLGPDEEHNVETQLGLLSYAKQLGDKPPDAGEVERLNAQAPADIRRALQPFGWYSPQVRSTLTHDGNDWNATYTVNAGPETDVTAIDIRLNGPGAKLPELVAASKHLWPLKIGKRIKAQDYETFKQRLLTTARTQGFLHAEYTRHELSIDPAKHSARVLLALDTGPRYYFGTISIEQKHKRLGTDVIRRYVTFQTGQPFSSAQLLATQFALSDLGYFSSVQVEPTHSGKQGKPNSGNRIPVTIRVDYAKPRVYKFGVGYGTDTGARALAGVQWRRVNSRGHQLDIELRPSQKISSAVASYKIPIGSVPGQLFEFNTEGLRQNFQGIDEKLYSFGIARIQLNNYWQRRYYLTYTHDTYTIAPEPRQYSALLTPGISLNHSSTDNPIFPRHGWSAWFDLHGATRLDQVSSANFLEGHIKLRGVFPIGWRVRVLARAEEGFIVGTDFNRLPPSERFFAGGVDSVRGYSYRSLGPTNAYGRVVGGKYLTTGSLELDWDVHRPYALAAFVDAGGADNVPNVRLHFGAGIGFRYLAPFGALGLDLAHPFDRGQPAVRVDVVVKVGL